MELNDFIAYVQQHLDASSEESVLALEPQLRALGANRRFLAQYLASSLNSPTFQSGNPYAGHTFVLGGGKDFAVRAVCWLPAGDAQTQPHVYRAAEPDPIAHTHPFSLLTYGYAGPGYETAVYGCDPEELLERAVGEPIALSTARRHTLSCGEVLFFPAFRVAHIQYPPAEYSISLNLIVRPPNPRRYEQYFVSPARQVLTGATNGQLHLAVGILDAARYLAPERSIPLLTQIAAVHPLRTVREHAAKTLEVVHERITYEPA